MSTAIANIHPDAQIGENVVIEPFATIQGDVVIGDGTWVAPGACIMDGARIGKNCKIFPGAVISAVPQDLKYQGEKTIVEIGDNTVIREYVTVHKGTSDREKTTIGKNCLIMIYVHIAHDCIVGDNCIIAGYSGLAGHCVVEDFAILEGMVAVQQFVRVGAHSFVSGASLVRKNVPPFVKAAREPLSYVGINSVGMKRRGFSDETINQIEEIYRAIYVRNQNVSKGIAEVEAEIAESPERNAILDFIKNSPKGIMRGSN